MTPRHGARIREQVKTGGDQSELTQLWFGLLWIWSCLWNETLSTKPYTILSARSPDSVGVRIPEDIEPVGTVTFSSGGHWTFNVYKLSVSIDRRS